MAFTDSARRFGWIPQLPDYRDLPFTAKKSVAELPSAVDLRPVCPPIFDQGRLGSCVANAVSAAMRKNQLASYGPSFTPSRLFIYYNARAYQGWEGEDMGAYIRDGIKSVNDWGAAAEGRNTSGSWEYYEDMVNTRPHNRAYNHAANHQSLEYYAVPQTPSGIKSAIAEGYLVVYGFSVYENFWDAGTNGGIVAMPRGSMIGGHAVCAVGYNDATKKYICQNSWGPAWGDKGFFYMPYEYVESASLADDFWVIKTQELGQGFTPSL